MTLLPLTDRLTQQNTMHPPRIRRTAQRALHEQVPRNKGVNVILLVVALYQLIEVLGILLMKSPASIGTVVLNLLLCASARLFKHRGKDTVVSILLIALIDVECGLLLLTTPIDLGVSDLPTFDLLVVSELMAVSLVPPMSVFLIVFSSVVFIGADLVFQPQTPKLHLIFTSSMGFHAIIQPISLHLVVAMVSSIGGRNGLLTSVLATRQWYALNQAIRCVPPENSKRVSGLVAPFFTRSSWDGVGREGEDQYEYLLALATEH